MRVGMDISQLAHKGGVATYTDKLSQQLSNISDLEMVYFFSSLRKKSPLFIHGNIKKFYLPPTLFEILFNRWRNVPIERFLGPIDIFHSSDWTQPPTKAKKVTTYHDVIPIKYPEWSHPKIVDVHKRRLSLVEKEIDHVIVVSETTKRDLMEVSLIPEKKITVIFEGPSADFKPQPNETIKRFKQKYSLPEKFVLAIGGIGERRNLDRIKQAAKDYNLVVTGQTIPWLELDELGQLYQSASVLIYASLYEGFGIPILDAFACGIPVITSDLSSMPEVGGDAAIYVDPYSVENIKEKINMVTTDQKLRQEVIKKGFERVRQFSWKKAAEQTYLIYQNLSK